jgi:arylsulfatase A-like enzyme
MTDHVRPKDRKISGIGKTGSTRRSVLHGAAAAGVAASFSSLPGCAVGAEKMPPAKRPNILFVFSDQHRHDAVGAAGNPFIATPTLDRLAREGTLFSRLWVQSPVCRPSRASAITGRYPHQHGIATNSAPPFDPKWPTMMKNLRAAGYLTASYGKTHFGLSVDEQGGADAPPREYAHDSREDWPYIASFGYDYVGEEGGQWYPAMKGFSSPYTDYLRERGLLEAYRKSVLQVWTDTEDQWKPFVTPFKQQDDVTSFVARQVIDLINTRDTSKPFFITYAPIKPHVPLAGDPIWAAYYANRDVPGGPRDRAENVNPIWADWMKRRYRSSHSEILNEERITNAKRMYYAMVSLVDQKLGEIIDVLDKRGELDNTWIIYSSDHGEMMGDHFLMGKSVFYHAAVGVPAIIRAPGKVPKTRRVDTPVQQIDLPSTILDIAQASPLEGAQGHSLLPVIKGKAPKTTVAYSEISNKKGEPYFVAVTDGRYRYTVDYKTRTPCELFDLKEDPQEVNNLVDEPKHAGTIKEMQAELIEPHMKDA